MKKSFRSFKSQDPQHLSDEERSQMERLAQLAQPYANMSEDEIMRQLKGMARNPQVAQMLQGQSLTDLASKLSPYLDGAQRQKLASILSRLKS